MRYAIFYPIDGSPITVKRIRTPDVNLNRRFGRTFRSNNFSYWISEKAYFEIKSMSDKSNKDVIAEIRRQHPYR